MINSKGIISPRYLIFSIILQQFSSDSHLLTSHNRSQPAGTQNQAAALRAEGVTVETGALGELIVDFAEYGWFPDILPSEAGQDDEQEEEESNQ